MTPAYSVIVFTVASGAGFGLMMALALGALLGLTAPDRDLGLLAFALAFALAVGGLLSSTTHLGRPERAWRAVTQWQTSWLSREGVAAILTFPPAAVFGWYWAVDGEIHHIAGLLTLLTAFVTVLSTGMIYQSLPTIRAWANPLVTPVYIALALVTGGMLLCLCLAVLGVPQRQAPWLALLPLALVWLLKTHYWKSIDEAPRTLTSGAATGLGGPARGGARVRPLDPPHTQANYVMREMGFEVGRRHAERLRAISAILLFPVPGVLLLAAFWLQSGPLVIAAALLATLSAGVGVFIERWLFFAEAVHVVTLYYGREAA